MHVGQQSSPGLVDESYLVQHNLDSMCFGGSVPPTGVQFLDPGPGKSSFQFEYFSPCVRIRRDFQHGQMTKRLYGLAVHYRHKLSLQILSSFEEGAIHGEPLNAKSIEPTDGYQVTVAVVQFKIIL